MVSCQNGPTYAPKIGTIINLVFFLCVRYKCTGDDSCVDHELVCNGHRDCADGSDEIHCGKPS